MKCIVRHILGALSFLSLLLCLATLVAWAAARSHPFAIGWYSNGREPDGSGWRTAQYGIGAYAGRITIGRTTYLAGDYNGDTDDGASRSFAESFPASRKFFFEHAVTFGFVMQWESLGIRRSYDQRFVGRLVFTGSALGAPAWLVALAFSLLPATRAIVGAARRAGIRSRTRAGRCQACGYDLRASPDRCPECGSPVKDVAALDASGAEAWRAERAVAVAKTGCLLAMSLESRRKDMALLRSCHSPNDQEEAGMTEVPFLHACRNPWKLALRWAIFCASIALAISSETTAV